MKKTYIYAGSVEDQDGTTRLLKIDDSFYIVKYLVLGGEMDGSIVQLTYGTPHLLRSIKNKFKNVRDFETEVIDSINILHHKGNPVTEDVLYAYNNMLSFEYWAVTGKYDKNVGWKIL